MTARKRLSLSVGISALILILSYFMDNQPFPIVGEVTPGQRFEQLKELLKGHPDTLPGRYVAIDIAYDRQLVEVTDEFGFPKGCISITDRQKLLWLAERMRGTDYRFLVLDIDFGGICTPSDSALFSLLATMPRVVTVIAPGQDLPPQLAAIGRRADYGVTIENTNFSKYDYIPDGEPSLALEVCRSIGGPDLKKYGIIYTDGKHLCRRSAGIPIHTRLWNRYKSANGDLTEKSCHYLGADIIDMDVDVAEMVKGKIVVVGDYSENDMHDTCIGTVAGPALHINAIDAAINGILSISWSAVATLFLLYAIIAWWILSGYTVMNHISPRRKYLKWLLSCIGISTLLYIISLGGWLIYGIEPNVWVASAIFSITIITNDIIQLKKKK